MSHNLKLVIVSTNIPGWLTIRQMMLDREKFRTQEKATYTTPELFP